MKEPFTPDTENLITHLSYDFGDPSRSDKTTAVLNLVNETRKFADVFVVDLQRTTSFKSEKSNFISPDHLSITSFGLPFGIFHLRQLNRVLKKIIEIADSGIRKSSVIHAHKLSFEGYLGWRLSRKYNIPLFITLRQTDFVILKYRPDLKRLYERVLQDSSKIFYIVPFMIGLLEEVTGKVFFNNHVKHKLVYLPNIVPIEPAVYPVPREDAPLVSILRFTRRSVKRKNIRSLLKAFSEISSKDIRLILVGGGDYLGKVQKWADAYKLGDRVTFTGEVPNSEIDRFYINSRGFVLPSFSESFGLVYAEALLKGTPILFSKGVIGFDGIFENVGPAVDPNSIESIKKGIEDIYFRNKYYREQIKKLQQTGAFNIFSASYAYDTYKRTFDEVLKVDFSAQKEKI